MHFLIKKWKSSSLWVWGHAVTPSRFLKFLCLWNSISRILGVILSNYVVINMFLNNGVLTTLNFYNYFLADPLGNCDLKVIGKTAFNAEFLTVANTLLRYKGLFTLAIFMCMILGAISHSEVDEWTGDEC